MYYKDFDYRKCSESPFEFSLTGNYEKTNKSGITSSSTLFESIK